LSVAGLFAGIGGIELGLHDAGHRTVFLCELDDRAKLVLEERFGIEPVADVAKIDELPDADLVTAGFPCQDLSQAGRTIGIKGSQSSLVEHVFELIARASKPPRWLLLENVPFMLQLQRGAAMRFLVDSLETLGFTWAYRVVDSRAFGLPQRRQRVLLLASQDEDPRPVLFTEDEGERTFGDPANLACGFYWTEGTRGLGWAVDAIPTLKGGSGLGIPSPPAIRLPDRRGVVVPEIGSAERLQGFPTGWTLPALDGKRRSQGARWKMVGNAVSVPVSAWIGRRLRESSGHFAPDDAPLPSDRWPLAAWGQAGKRRAVNLSMWPIRAPYRHLEDVVAGEHQPLSARATSGFLSRAHASSLRFPPDFLDAVEAHLLRVTPPQAEAA
jgi:DNA (cytosine-5)-methyltransferase 1